MKKIWIDIKAVCVVMVAVSIIIITAFATMVYGIWAGLKKIRIKPRENG